jgi:hypothetical protein
MILIKNMHPLEGIYKIQLAWRSQKHRWQSQVWWLMPVILALRRLRQKDHKFEANLII